MRVRRLCPTRSLLGGQVFVLSQLSNGFRAARHARVQQLKQSETKRLMSEALASRIAGVFVNPLFRML
jgi:hypothetical protein